MEGWGRRTRAAEAAGGPHIIDGAHAASRPLNYHHARGPPPPTRPCPLTPVQERELLGNNKNKRAQKHPKVLQTHGRVDHHRKEVRIGLPGGKSALSPATSLASAFSHTSPFISLAASLY